MDIEEHLLKGHNKELTQELVDYIGHSKERFDEFMPYFLHDEYRICQRAAWTLGIVCQNHPELILPWLPQILMELKTPKHDAQIRNTVRALEVLEHYPEEFEGEIYEQCFEYLLDPKYPIAIKVFSMTVCSRIALKYPELIPELIDAIEDQMETGSAGYRSRAKKELARLSKCL
jgi:hypothetical protein